MDPVNTVIRRSVTIRRRVYCVDGPNSLWYIDGHHKLIKWRFVADGGIDSFSRTIVYLHCSTNNFPSTVMASFADAVCKYGVPNQIRSDLSFVFPHPPLPVFIAQGSGAETNVQGL